MICVLCGHSNTSLYTKDNYREYVRCNYCDLIFVPPQFHLSREAEKNRYDKHENQIDDIEYRSYLTKFLKPLLQHLSPGMSGLDFGCGPAPAMEAMLNEKGFTATSFDPFYANHPERLTVKYDFVTCAEVVEHFSHPSRSWDVLAGLLKPNSPLAIMTMRHDTVSDFKSWWYKNDSSHVAFYSDKTLRYLGERFKLSIIHSSRLVTIFS